MRVRRPVEILRMRCLLRRPVPWCVSIGSVGAAVLSVSIGSVGAKPRLDRDAIAVGALHARRAQRALGRVQARPLRVRPGRRRGRAPPQAPGRLDNLGFLVLMLLPRFLNHFWERNMSFGKWAISLFSSPIHKRKLYFWVLWFLMEGSRNRKFWLSLVVYLLWLLKMPWFWGYATSEDGEISPMYLSGWKLKAPNNPVMVDKLGSPDIMVITLPVMYLVVTPVIVITYALFAERSAFHYSCSWKTKCLSSPVNLNMESKQNPAKIESFVFTCGGGARKILLFLCMIITLVHLKICTTLMLAYGVVPVALSPALCWMPPLLLVAAMYSTTTMDSKVLSSRLSTKSRR